MQKICTGRGLRARVAAMSVTAAALGCGVGGPGIEDENEIISRVELTFTPAGGGEPRVFAFDDPDGDGGVSGVADTVELSAGVEYTLTVRFINAIADPPEDITEEIAAEAEDHMIFVVGDVAGPGSATAPALLTHAYADRESDYGENSGDDLPVGLANTITGDSAGSGELRVILRHVPPLNDLPQKTADLPADLAAGRDLPGSVDADLTFALVVS
jgi:hypothetical protein